MRKPAILMPFIIVYKIVFGILKLPILICKYFYRGIITTLKVILKIFIRISWLVYQVPKFFLKGIGEVVT